MTGALACLALGAHAVERVRSAVLGVGAAASVAATPAPSAVQPTASAPPTTAARVLSSEDWLREIRSERFWSARKSGGSGWSSAAGPQAMRLSGPAQPASMTLDSKWGDGSYRTLCVRLCDGYFFPVSAAVFADAFEADAQKCASSCDQPARLFVYRNGSETPDDMVDLQDRPYRRLRTAFLYRTSYDASCKCKPHPWEQEAVDRHRMYALQLDAKKGNRKAAAELAQMKAKPVARPPAAAGLPDAMASAGRKSKSATKPAARTQATASADWDGEDAMSASKAAAMAAAPVTAPRPKPTAKVIRLGSGGPGPVLQAAPPPRLKVTSRDDDWRRRALNAR